MVGKRQLRPRGDGRHYLPGRLWIPLLLVFLILGEPLRGALQFDVFPGYDGIVPEGSWFPILFEIKNDGSSFNGTIEVTGGNNSPGQTYRITAELPTGTLKRFTVPVFSTSRGYSTWDVRLIDEKQKVRAEQTGLRPRKQVAAKTPLIGALVRTAGGTPILPPINSQASSDLQPSVARLQPSIFPDNPLVLEGLDAIYLNSEKASELKDPQIAALYAWLYAGGHLIVGVEQISDISAAGWLKGLFPIDLTNVKTIQKHSEIQAWLKEAAGSTNEYVSNFIPQQPGRNRPRLPGRDRSTDTGADPYEEVGSDPAFENADLQIAVGTVRDGQVKLSAADAPLLVTAIRGRGRITVMLFSPEREPFRSWKNLPVFWARMLEVPGWTFGQQNNNAGGWSSDGIFGAMIDSRQVHKLPIEWLLLLLIVYLIVIGPLDQYWLKRIGRPMLTWITFPCYVVFFSLLIYFIGYKLRAGESEWNELHVVDLLPKGEKGEMRGRTYVSVYSPANQRYDLESHQRFATLRGEFVGSWGGGQATEKATVVQNGDNFKAQIFVPVWTSQLFISDWWQPSGVPLSFTVRESGDGWIVQVDNQSDKKISNVHLAIRSHMFSLGEFAPKHLKNITLRPGSGVGAPGGQWAVREFVSRYAQPFQSAVQSRQHAFGSSESGRIDDVPNSAIAASMVSLIRRDVYAGSFISPPGLDVAPAIEHGNAVLFAWVEDYSPIKPMYNFSPRRSHKNTLWRMTVPIQ